MVPSQNLTNLDGWHLKKVYAPLKKHTLFLMIACRLKCPNNAPEVSLIQLYRSYQELGSTKLSLPALRHLFGD
jgi:hypothetical protein